MNRINTVLHGEEKTLVLGPGFGPSATYACSGKLATSIPCNKEANGKLIIPISTDYPNLKEGDLVILKEE